MSRALEQHWEILKRLPKHPRRITARELTEMLHDAGMPCTKRTVERTLQDLSLSFPIMADERSKPYGWSWARDAESMTLPGMDLQTSLAFVAAEAFLKPLLPKSTLSYLEPHFRMARARLDSEPETFGSWKDKVRSLPRGFRLLAPEIDPIVEEVIYDGVLKNRVIDLSYHGRTDAKPKRFDTVHPLALVYREPLVYLVCTMWDYQTPRQLVLHRIQSAVMLSTTSVALPGFNIDDYVADGEFGFRVGPVVRLKARFHGDAAVHLFETPVSEDQQLTILPDRQVLLEASVPHTEELIWWLRSFGSLVTVLSPDLE